MKLKDFISNRTTRLNRSHAKECPTCGGIMPRKLHFEIDDVEVCRVCYMRHEETKLRYCPRCRTEKAGTKSNYYQKVRGRGLMVVCRTCRDSELRRHNKRMCKVCWLPSNGGNFTPREWFRPQPEIATCMSCQELKRKKVPRPAVNEKTCPRCATIKPLTAFYIVSSRVSAYCKECTKAYNRERYEGRRDNGQFSTRTVATLYHLQAAYSEQELVNMWAGGEVPKIPQTIRAPKENFARATKKELSSFMVGHERGLNLKKVTNDESQHKEEQGAPRRFRLKKRKRRGG